VPSDIYFGGGNLYATVEEDPGQVAEAFTAAGGVPFRLTRRGSQGDLYVNPAAVAFWSVAEAPPDGEPSQDPAPPPKQREAVTDIWGQPLRRKPRR
jgi:hypothetical protein